MSNSWGRWLFGLEKPTKGWTVKEQENFLLEWPKEKLSDEIIKENLFVDFIQETFRPTDFNHYIGQNKAKETLQAYIQATKERKKQFPHILISGSAGHGKTTLARIIANTASQEKIREYIGSDVLTADILIEGGFIFIDEIHAMPREIAEKFYIALEDGVLNGKRLKPFTLIGATTELGEILKNRKPFFDRFKLMIELEDYTEPELYMLLAQYNKHQFPGEQLSKDILTILSQNARLTPRIGIKLLEGTIYLKSIDSVLRNNNIIKRGYTHKDLEVLEYLKDNEKGVGLSAIAGFLGTSEDNYLFQIENYLLKQKLINRTGRGRKITNKGIELIKELE